MRLALWQHSRHKSGKRYLSQGEGVALASSFSGTWKTSNQTLEGIRDVWCTSGLKWVFVIFSSVGLSATLFKSSLEGGQCWNQSSSRRSSCLGIERSKIPVQRKRCRSCCRHVSRPLVREWASVSKKKKKSDSPTYEKWEWLVSKKSSQFLNLSQHSQ